MIHDTLYMIPHECSWMIDDVPTRFDSIRSKERVRRLPISCGYHDHATCTRNSLTTLALAHKHAQRGHETFGQETHKCLGTFVHKHITSGPQDSEGISQGKQAQFLKPTMYMAGSPNLHWGTSTPVGSRTTKYIGGRASSLSDRVVTECDPVHT